MNKLSPEHISSKIFQNIQIIKDNALLSSKVSSAERGLSNSFFLLISELIYKWAGTLSTLDSKYFFSPENFLSTSGHSLSSADAKFYLIISLMIKGVSILFSLVFLSKATVGILDLLFYNQEKLYKIVFNKLLHYIYLPHRSLRTNALKISSPLKFKPLFKDKAIFQNLSKTNLKEWTDLNIYNKTCIHNLINNHCLGLPELRPNHLYWSQLIPREKLNLDQYRTLLDSCPIVNISLDLSSLVDISLSDLEFIFKDYTPSDIMRLYKSPYYIYQLVSILNIANKHSTNLPVYIDINQLYSFTKKLNLGDNFSFKVNHPWVFKIEGPSTLGNIKHISNVIELDNAGSYMSNCVRDPMYNHPYRSGARYLFLITSPLKESIIFELNRDGSLKQAKYKANKEISSEDKLLLKAIIKERRS